MDKHVANQPVEKPEHMPHEETHDALRDQVHKAHTEPTHGADMLRTAQSSLDKLHLDDKLNLTPEQSNTLRAMETSILKGDLKTVENTLNKYSKDPDALKPVMDVLIKDLKENGIRASYSVDFALTNDGQTAERTGMFGLTTAMTPEEWMTKPSKDMCIYTNPNSSTWASNETPVTLKDAMRSPISEDAAPADAFKTMGQIVAKHALEQN
jgi:hypothetical protein